MKLILENWRGYLDEGLKERRADAKLFFNAQDGTLRELILTWIKTALPEEGVRSYHSKEDKWAGSDFAKAEAQRYISEYLLNSPITQMLDGSSDTSEGEDWERVGLNPQAYDAFLSFDTLIDTIKSMYEDSRMNILHNDPMSLMGDTYPGGIIHFSLLFLGRGLIKTKKQYKRRNQ